MRPLLNPGQGRIVRGVVLYLSKGGGKPAASDVVIESIASQPWASLTFTGERHRVAIRLPGRAPDAALDGDELAVPGVIIAVERAEWTTLTDGMGLTLDLLTIDER